MTEQDIDLAMDRTGLPEGILGAVVSPAYVAFAVTESEYVAPERRSLITWVERWDLGVQHVVGYAEPDTAAGQYGFVQYFRHPTEPAYLVGRLDQLVVQSARGPKRIGPISMSDGLIIAQV